LAITEYNYGASADISGGLAEADALGIFGREGLYAATYFALNDSGDPYVYAAMRLFRNYDGQGSRYGDQWVPVQWSDRAGYSAYAASYAGNPGHLSLLLINKQNAAKEAQVLLNGGSQHFTFADTYTLTAAGGPQPVQGASIQLAGNSSFNATLPAMSATLLDLYVVQ
jgi:mannan endo-1,4-beta-mannosidase